MFKIGVISLNGKLEDLVMFILTRFAALEKDFASYATSAQTTRRNYFARSVGPEIWPARVRVNNQDIELELHCISLKKEEQASAFAFKTNCNGYVLAIDNSVNYTPDVIEALIDNALRFEKKAINQCPFTIVAISKNGNNEIQKFAESKGISYEHIWLSIGMQYPDRPLIEDQQVRVIDILAALVGRINDYKI